LNYAPATSASQLEIFFTRLDPNGPAIYVSNRRSISEPFAEPRKIAAIAGFAEGPTLSPDEKSLYYHKKDAGRFVIYRVTRP
jgi:Tol biopolymer transport system component